MTPRVRPTASVRRRLVALTGTLAVLVALALVTVVHVVLDRATSDTVQRLLVERADALVAATDEATTGDRLVVPDDQLQDAVLVLDATGRPVAGSLPPAVEATARRLVAEPREEPVEVGDTWWVLARPIEVSSGARGTAVLAEPLAPYEDDEHAAVVVSLVAGGLMVLLAIAVAAWISRQVLVPVQAMADTARDWSEHDLDRRFDLGPPTDEIRALGRTLDELLERVASTIRAEQRLTAELAHELRSPLTAVQATAELALTRDDLDEELRRDLQDVLDGCRAMAATMTVLLDIARRQASGYAGAADAATGADLLGARLRARFPDPRLVLRLPPDLALVAPVDVAVRALSPVLENALAVAGPGAGAVVLSAGPAAAGQVALRVADDGPGIEAAVADRLFEPGATGRGGSGLGLPLARRVARSVGGDVRVGAGPGTVFEVLLPGLVSGPRS